jgi:ferredoxin
MTQPIPLPSTQAATAPAADHAFILHLAQRGLKIEVAPGESILDTLEMEGVIVPSVCREGICGTCECAVLEGDIDHRDQVLTPEERAGNKVMMVCVSRARGDRLVLDL